MPHEEHTVRRRSILLGLGPVAGSAALAASGCRPAPSPSPEPSQIPTSPSPSAGVCGAVPVTDIRPRYHFSVPDHWKNDPQRPLWIDGRWHYWYLYNADYPTGNGTAWRLATSTDLVTWTDEGISIPKYTNRNGDPWSGSAVVDADNSAGLGRGAVLALVTQPGTDGHQAQYLWRSTDGGRRFLPVGSGPVIPNPGLAAFRDPKVVRDETGGGWLAIVAEGDHLGFWRSRNLRSWQASGGFTPRAAGAGDLGVLECPDLFRITADDGTTTWVLGCSANGSAQGLPSTFAYWTGQLRDTTFMPDRATARWLDVGYDFYGAVSFEHRTDPTHKRHVVAWMNSWNYPRSTPTWPHAGFNGVDSCIREVTCHRTTDGYVLRQQPVLGPAASATVHLGDHEVSDTQRLGVRGVAYRLDADITWEPGATCGFRLRVAADGSHHIDAGITGGHSFLNRQFTGSPDTAGRFHESRAPLDGTSTHLTVLVDTTSTELFVGDGTVVHTSQTFPDPSHDHLELFATNGVARFSNVLFTPLAAVSSCS